MNGLHVDYSFFNVSSLTKIWWCHCSNSKRYSSTISVRVNVPEEKNDSNQAQVEWSWIMTLMLVLCTHCLMWLIKEMFVSPKRSLRRPARSRPILVWWVFSPSFAWIDWVRTSYKPTEWKMISWCSIFLDFPCHSPRLREGRICAALFFRSEGLALRLSLQRVDTRNIRPKIQVDVQLVQLCNKNEKNNWRTISRQRWEDQNN